MTRDGGSATSSGHESTERQDDSVVHEPSAATTAWLRLFSSPAGIAFPLAATGTTVGRHSGHNDADIAVRDTSVSRSHVRIWSDGQRWILEDLGSRNGCYLDGAHVPPRGTAVLGPGSVVRLGRAVAVFATAQGLDGHDPDAGFFPGVSAAAVHVRERVRRLAASSGHVLVLGETGTGKERTARRLAGPGAVFVPQNCAELSRDLARSELFGHVRGAFSGATEAREGLIESARDGALFLDEIAEIPWDTQGELLRFLDDGTFRRLGSNELRTSKARIIAATNVDLDGAVTAGRFRRDLLARLRASNQPVELPALRDRREDIPGWVDLFARELRPTDAQPTWTTGALECLLLYSWPENLRELRGAVRGALGERQALPMEPATLPERIELHRRLARGTLGTPSTSSNKGLRITPTREQIAAALTETSGCMRTTAELLGIERRALYRLCEKYAIEPDDFRKPPAGRRGGPRED
jgi:DNA-binding NtrC family response regulator